MEKVVIRPKGVAAPVYGAYSHGIRVGNPDSSRGRIKIRDMRGQAEQVFENIKAVLAEAGASYPA